MLQRRLPGPHHLITLLIRDPDLHRGAFGAVDAGLEGHPAPRRGPVPGKMNRSTASVTAYVRAQRVARVRSQLDAIAGLLGRQSPAVE